MDGTHDTPGARGTASDRPRPLGEARTHYWLALGMAQTVGLDLQAEIDAGRFTQADWADTVQRCRGCDWADECPSWMQRQHDGAARAPGECRNAARFNALLDLDESPAR
jgi:hypothetical protein